MKIVVTIKQVYDPETVRVSRSLGMLDTRQAELMMNPGDRHALEEALKLKDENAATVVAVSLGPPEAEDILREALAMGVDEAVLLTGDALAEVDAPAAVMVLGEAIKRIGDHDLVVTGVRAAGDGTGEFAPRLAGYLGLPHVLRATSVSVTEGRLSAKRSLSSGYALVEAALPAVVAVEEGSNRPRHPSLPGSIAAYDEHSVMVWGVEELGLTAEDVAEARRTEVRGSEAAPERERGRAIAGEPSDAARELVGELSTRGLLSRSR